jgi:hypothetical protein
MLQHILANCTLACSALTPAASAVAALPTISRIPGYHAFDSAERVQVKQTYQNCTGQVCVERSLLELPNSCLKQLHDCHFVAAVDTMSASSPCAKWAAQQMQCVDFIPTVALGESVKSTADIVWVLLCVLLLLLLLLPLP